MPADAFSITPWLPTKMKFAILADVHANLEALPAVLRYAGEQL
jgi:hypothetical protein